MSPSPSDPKTCFKCGIEKTRAGFYKHSKMADGLLGKCKECAKKDVQGNYRANHDYYIQYEKKRYRLPHRVAARKKYAIANPDVGARRLEKYYKRYPERKSANNKVSNAIRDGKLHRSPSCELCGSCFKVEAHHDDYSKPLEVVWLCKPHHIEADRKRKQREEAA